MINDNYNSSIANRINQLNDMANANKLFRTAALNSLSMISYRVQNQGEGVNGKIQSSSDRKFGAYSYNYGKKRDKDGRQTSIIDATYSGDMMDNFVPLKKGNEFMLMFRGKESADKAEWMEDRFGELFSMTEQETFVNLDAINRAIDDIFR